MARRHFVTRVGPAPAVWTLVVTFAAIATLTTATLSAQGKWWKSERLVALLRLTPEQSEQLERIHESMAPSLRAAMIAVNQREARFSELLKRDDATEGDVMEEIGSLETARGELSKLRTLQLYRMRRVLTPEQRATFEADFERNRSSRTPGDRPPPGRGRGAR